MDKKIDTVLVVFSATSIHKELAMQALDMTKQNNAKLIILSVRDKKVAESVAKMTKNHGFLGERVVETSKKKLVSPIPLISRRLGTVEKEAQKRGIAFETVRVKGDFVEKVANAAEDHEVDIILMEDMGKKVDNMNRKVSCKIIVVN